MTFLEGAFVRAIAALALFAMPGLVLGDVTLMPGSSPQTAPAMAAFPNPFIVRVTDGSGAPVPGAAVYYRDASGATEAAESPVDCWLDFMIVVTCQVTTDDQGIARLPRMRGRYAGHFTPNVEAVKGATRIGTTSLDLTVLPLQTPAQVAIAVGNGQQVVAGTQLAPIVVQVTSFAGSPVAGAKVYYEPITFGPGGFVAPLGTDTVVFTDTQGKAALPPLIASWGMGPHAATVRYFDEAARAYVKAGITYTSTNAAGGLELSLQDLWWSGPAENGWGLSVVQHGPQLFNVFFVYDDAGNPTWYVQPGGGWNDGVGSYFTSPAYSPRGAPWFAYDATKFDPRLSTGNSALNFSGPDAAFLSLSDNSRTRFGWAQKHVVRLDFQRPTPSPLTGVGDMWWGGPAQNGWGIAIHEQAGALFLVWFTYDAAGLPTWFVMPGGDWVDASTYAGTIYHTHSSLWFGTYDPSQLQSTAVGTFRLRFAGTQQATFEYTLEGRSGSLTLQRQAF